MSTVDNTSALTGHATPSSASRGHQTLPPLGPLPRPTPSALRSPQVRFEVFQIALGGFQTALELLDYIGSL